MEKGFISGFNYCLVGKIKGLSLTSKETSKRIHKVKSNQELYRWQERKRAIGYDARHHLLAYAYLKGKSYKLVERQCRIDNQPRVEDIFKIIAYHTYSFKIKNGDFSQEKIIAWLSGEI